jgi:hypothetical protein
MLLKKQGFELDQQDCKNGAGRPPYIGQPGVLTLPKSGSA